MSRGKGVLEALFLLAFRAACYPGPHGEDSSLHLGISSLGLRVYTSIDCMLGVVYLHFLLYSYKF